MTRFTLIWCVCVCVCVFFLFLSENGITVIWWNHMTECYLSNAELQDMMEVSCSIEFTNWNGSLTCK